MHIRSFSAATAQAAIAKVREEMGETAVIIAVDHTPAGRGVVVRAALEAGQRNKVSTRLLPIEQRLERFLMNGLAAARQTSPATA